MKKKHEWQLTAEHARALKSGDYETCAKIQDEINKRIDERTIIHALMDGFKYFNIKTQKYEGRAKYKGLNGLFDKYKALEQ